MLKYQDNGHWASVRDPEKALARTNAPNVLSIDQAIDWIRKERPLLWIGSIFSVPEPSNIPSGFSLTVSLLNILLPYTIPENLRNELITTLSSKWSLEALLDEFEFVKYDISESLLNYFKKINNSASPNTLHEAVLSYYQQGLAQHQICITTNWDTLLEKVFRQNGYKVISGGVDKPQDKNLSEIEDNNSIFIFHPHGSFETNDIICSSKLEQSQLPFNSSFHETFEYPILFLGYSGYEPSLYMNIEGNDNHQLWCVRDNDDLRNPLKKRLLCRPNVSVFIGDICELLLGLGVLQKKVTIKNLLIHKPDIPKEVIEIVLSGVLSTIDTNICVNLLPEAQLLFQDEPQSSYQYAILMKALVQNIRNRISHPGILPALMTSVVFHDSEQIWISALAYMLRMNKNLDMRIIKKLLEYADRAAKVSKETRAFGEAYSLYDSTIYGLGISNRATIYKSFINNSELAAEEFTYNAMSYVTPDVAGELYELFAFKRLRQGNMQSARNIFDYASTKFYLLGLWNSGELNEWASKNIESMIEISKNNTMFIPKEEKK